MTRKVDLRNNLSFNVFAKSIEFPGDNNGNTPGQSLGSSVVWLHRAGSGSVNENTFSISPVYTRELSRMWKLQASYQFAVQKEDDGTAVQDMGFLTLARGFILAR